MERYIVIAGINGKDYMVNVPATSLLNAEHIVMDRGICGRHEYTVEGCMAFGIKEMKTDCFIGMALNAKTVSLTELFEIIEKRNAQIKEKDKTEDRIKEIEKQMAQLTAELEEAKKILAA